VALEQQTIGSRANFDQSGRAREGGEYTATCGRKTKKTKRNEKRNRAEGRVQMIEFSLPPKTRKTKRKVGENWGREDKN
jgi:hypothetical protein